MLVLSADRDDAPLDIELPNQWLWDIVDEFIYQVHTCTHKVPEYIQLATGHFPSKFYNLDQLGLNCMDDHPN